MTDLGSTLYQSWEYALFRELRCFNSSEPNNLIFALEQVLRQGKNIIPVMRLPTIRLRVLPDFVNAPPKSRLGHPTFRLITIYSSVLSICNLHCRQGYKSCLWRIHICGSCYISSDNILLRGLWIYIYIIADKVNNLSAVRLITFQS